MYLFTTKFLSHNNNLKLKVHLLQSTGEKQQWDNTDRLIYAVLITLHSNRIRDTMKKIYILSEAKADSKKEERKTDSRDIDRSDKVNDGGKQVKTDNVDNAGLV